jgi:hypothetical protein
MALTDLQLQRSRALLRYPEALKKTRATYLLLLEAAEVSEEDTNSIWTASFVLQYMIASHNKYISLLASLNQDKRALALLGRLCDQLTVDPATNLQGFIDEAQTIMQGKAFKSDLAVLNRAYKIEGNVRNIGGILIIAAAIALCATLASLTGGLIMISALFFAVAAGYLIVTADLTWRKQVAISRSIDSLATTEPESCDFTEEYSYQTVNTENNSSTSTKISKSHQPQLITDLKQKFFQPQMRDREALSVEVQSQFNLLTN